METPDLSHLSSEDYNNVYEPAEDSFLMLDALEQDLSVLQSKLIVEIGSGSGITVTALAKHLNIVTLATDLNPFACEVTQRTAFQNATQVEAIRMDLLQNFRPNLFDVIIFNPPYVVTESTEIQGNGIERSWAGGVKGREVLDRILGNIKNSLVPGGLFYLVTIKENDPDEIRALMNKDGFISNLVMERKVRGEHLKIIRFSKALKC